MTIADQKERARRLFEDFHGREPGEGDLKEVEIPGKLVCLVVGHVDTMVYQRAGTEKHFQHDFDESDRPLLVSTAEGDQLILIGGGYKFTDQGIKE